MRQLFLTALLLFQCAALQAETVKINKVWVDQSFINLFAGPDGDFERIDVAQRGDWLDLTRQQGNWFQVETREKRQYWISYQQLLGCRTKPDGPLLSSILPKNWFTDLHQLGFGGGVLADSPAIQMSLTRRLNDFLALNGTISGIGLDSGSAVLYQGGLQIIPLDTESWKTYLEFSGGGYYRSFDDDAIDASHRPHIGIAGAVGYRLGDRFNIVARAQYHSLFKARLNEADNLKGLFFLIEYKF